MADKFGRNYELKIETETGVLTIAPPFTVEFDITRNTLTSANVCQIRIYNLGLKTRNQIRHNAYDFGIYKKISFRAGYGSNLPEAFTGNITAAWSVREGTNFITQIECYDGGYAFMNGRANVAFPAGVQRVDVIEQLMRGLPKVERGVVGSYPGTLSRGNSYSGNSVEILSQLTGGGFFIDGGRANALSADEYIAGPAGVAVINSKSGLLGTPVLEQTVVRFDMIFEPRLNIGQKIRLESITEANFNGDYKVTAVKHRGMISDAVAGAATTTGEFYYSKALTAVTF